MFPFRKRAAMPEPGQALPGRSDPIPTAERHFVNGRALHGPYPEGLRRAVFGLGCFWGAERKFWERDGVWVTAVGYAAGTTPNPTYEEVCSGLTGHNEVVLAVYDPAEVSYEDLLKTFWESHDPTQGMRQGNDVGTQYRSGIYVADEDQRRAAEVSKRVYGEALRARGYGSITTEIVEVGPFFFAEDYHQQYLAKNPRGYCGLGGTGVSCPVGVGVPQAAE
jgi:peptide-methionine (S)-S-oxide reductase